MLKGLEILGKDERLLYTTSSMSESQAKVETNLCQQTGVFLSVLETRWFKVIHLCSCKDHKMCLTHYYYCCRHSTYLIMNRWRWVFGFFSMSYDFCLSCCFFAHVPKQPHPHHRRKHQLLLHNIWLLVIDRILQLKDIYEFKCR